MEVATPDMLAAFVAHLTRGNCGVLRVIPMREVHDQPGGGTRRADLLALDCWKSRKWDTPVLRGYELKVSAGDWRRELRDPEKSAAFWRYVHSWTVVAPVGVVDKMTLPYMWGLVEWDGATFTETAKAREKCPDPMPLRLVACLLRAAYRDGDA